VFIQKQYKIIKKRLRQKRKKNSIACLSKRYIRKDKVGKAAETGV
jgi:hypothetical protein